MAQNTLPKPHARLGAYKGLAVRRTLRTVCESDIDGAVETLRRRAAVWQTPPADTPAARGDEVTLDFEGYDESGVPIPDSRMENVCVALGSGKLLPGAEKAVEGHCAGEAFRFAFTYPADFRVAELSEKNVKFEITLHTVRRKVLPVADDAFAAANGCADMAALRAQLRAEKEALHAENADRGAADALLAQAAANLADVCIPEEMTARMARRSLDALKQNLAAAHIPFEQYLGSVKKTEEQLLAGLAAVAEKRLRQALAVRCITDAEHLAPTPEDIENEYVRLAVKRGSTAEGMKKALRPEAVAEAVATERVRAFLLANAHVETIEETPGTPAANTAKD